MRAVMKKTRCILSLFCIGGLIYTIIETMWRGYSHWTMFFVGGLCFNLIGRIHTMFKCGIVLRCTMCAVVVTLIEFISGCIINLYFKMNVWDYSHLILNIKGQVCLIYSVLWGMLSVVAIPIYRRCCEHLDGKKPKKSSMAFLNPFLKRNAG